MTRLALLADIHGNLTALGAVLRDFERFEPDDILCLGDMASFGPQPQETLRRLRELNPQVVMGNTDAYLLKPRRLEDVKNPDENTSFFLEVEAWSAAQLNTGDLEYVRTFQPTIRLELDGLSLLAYHGSPKSYDEQIRATTPDETLDAYFEGEAADLYIGAHTHEQFVRRYHASILMNPGSVGLSFVVTPEGKGVNHPIAEYAWLEVANGEANLSFRRVPYDLDALTETVRKSAMPHRERWLEDFRPVRPRSRTSG